jgi:hypothetical protein
MKKKKEEKDANYSENLFLYDLHDLDEHYNHKLACSSLLNVGLY